MGSQAATDEVRTVNSVLTFCIGRTELKPAVYIRSRFIKGEPLFTPGFDTNC